MRRRRRGESGAGCGARGGVGRLYERAGAARAALRSLQVSSYTAYATLHTSLVVVPSIFNKKVSIRAHVRKKALI